MSIKLNTSGTRHTKIVAGIESLNGDKESSDNELFKSIIASYKEKFPMCDLSHMKMIMSPTPRNHDGDAKTNRAEIVKYTGSWTKLDTIVINTDMTKAIEFYGVGDRADNDTMTRQAIGHELAHELWHYGMSDECKERILKKAEDLKFDTPYLHHIDDDDPKEELFCEYMSYRVTGIWIKCHD